MSNVFQLVLGKTLMAVEKDQAGHVLQSIKTRIKLLDRAPVDYSCRMGYWIKYFTNLMDSKEQMIGNAQFFLYLLEIYKFLANFKKKL